MAPQEYGWNREEWLLKKDAEVTVSLMSMTILI